MIIQTTNLQSTICNLYSRITQYTAKKVRWWTMHRHGFTLIEAFFVMLLITVFTSLTLGYVQKVRREARDVIRLADLGQMRAALELFAHNTQSYPPGRNIILGGASAQSLNASGWVPETTGESVLMQTVPHDPLADLTPPCVKNVPQICAYTYTNHTSTDYSIRFYLEHGVPPLSAPGMYQLTSRGYRP